MSTAVRIAVLANASQAKREINDTESRASRLGSTMRKAGKIAAVGLAAGVVVAGKALFDMGKAAAEDAQQQAILANALRRSTGATKAQVAQNEKWIESMGRQYGVADDKLRPAIGNLARATGSLSKSQKLTSLAMEISAARGEDLETVSKKLAKAYSTGNVRALGAYGIATKDAEGKSISFGEAQDRLTKKFGGSAAAAANTFQGKMQRLKLQFDEAKEAIGARLLPVAEDLADWFVSDGLPKLAKFGRWFKANLLPPLKELGSKILTKAKAAGDDFKKAIADARPALELYGNYIKNVLVPVLKKAAEVVIPAVALAARGVGKALGVVGELGRAMWNNVLAPVFRLFAEAISKVLGGVSKMLGALGKVPGFGWAKDASKKLREASQEAGALADSIKAIPPSKKVQIRLSVVGQNAAAGAIIGALGGNGRQVSGRLATSAGRTIGSATPVAPQSIVVSLRLTADQVDQLTRGRQYQADIDAWLGAGGRVLSA